MSSVQHLIEAGAVHLHRTFEITAEEAELRAKGLAGLIEAKGGNASSFTIDSFIELITRELKDQYRWRNSADRERWEAEQKKTRGWYNTYLELGKDPSTRRW